MQNFKDALKEFVEYKTLSISINKRKICFSSSTKAASFIKDLIKIPYIDELEYYKSYAENTLHFVVFKINAKDKNKKAEIKSLLLKHKKNIKDLEVVY